MSDTKRIVREEFGMMCRTYNLLIETIGNDEVAMFGEGFLFLVWLEREGVSIKYVRLDRQKLEAIDIGSFLILKRGWVATDLPVGEEDMETRWRRECSSYALNMQKYAKDILIGETDWMGRMSSNPIVLSETTKKGIKDTLQKIRNK